MKTELEAVYHILNLARGGEHNNDEPLTERLIRSMLQNHRADSLRKFYKDGHYVDDEVFQQLTLTVIKNSNGQFQAQLPKTIRFDHHFGFYIEKNEIAIPIVNSQQYYLNKHNPHNKSFTFAKTEEQLLTFHIPSVTDILNADILSENYIFLKKFADNLQDQQIYNFNNPNDIRNLQITIDFYAVLLNPSDDPNYDWENDSYPFPSERLVELTTQVLAREFGIMATSKKDEIQNAEGDENKNTNNAKRNAGQQE